MSFFLFRVLVLLWNNAPLGLQKALHLTGLPRWVVERWMPFRDLPVPPTEQGVRHLIESLVQPGWVCADVGANYGMMTEFMAVRAGPRGRVIAFEAHPFNAGILQRRMKAKDLHDRVEVVVQAVSDGSQKVLRLYPGRRHSPNEWNIVGHDITGRQTRAVLEIPATSLDAHFRDTALNLVKVDVEGAESAVIAGAGRVLHTQRPFLIIEFHSAESWQSRHQILEAGYTIYRLNGDSVKPDDPLEYHVCACPPGVIADRRWFAGGS
jgi:FkbM family methyltransferase